jgi:hypothetical protein
MPNEQPGFSLGTVFRSRFAGRRRDLVSAVPHHQGWRLGARPVDLPHLGDLARRAAVGGAQARARRRILCRAASGQGGRLIVAARVVRQAVGTVRTHRAHLANTLCLPLRSSWRSAPPRMDDGDRGRRCYPPTVPSSQGVVLPTPFSPGGELCLDETFTREGAFKTGPRVDEEAWRHPLAA